MIEHVITRESINAPGCYASPSTFNRTSEICKVCPAIESCGERAAEKLKSLSKVGNISDFILRHDSAAIELGGKLVHQSEDIQLEVKKPVKRTQPVAMVKRAYTENEQAIIDSLPKKVVAMGKQFINTGLSSSAHKSLLGGSNPFPYDGKRFLHLASKLLLSDGFTRQGLKALYMAHGMGDATAASHVSMAIALLKAFKIVVETENKIIINKGNL